ncbi:D-2-hydroxyacid dehydrogenase [Rhodoblastus sp.]|uniref:D-2-hydroxyacid dehydrogenase n=1 Tax=Rhodoblastus sp. TaxID=1962975 RepID=UPI0035B24057
MRKIVFLDAATLAEGIVPPAPDFPHEWISYPATRPDEVVARAAEAEIVITNKVPVSASDIAALPKLRLIAVAATGYDQVDLGAARAAGIAVTNVVGYSTESVPEHAFALILALRRQILPYVMDVRAGVWQASGQFSFHTHPISDLRGKRLGLFGSGALGQEVARIAAAFGLETVFAGRKGEKARAGAVDFEEVLATADILSLHCPLNAETQNLLGWPEFSRMRRKPLLINTARGGIVDEEALERALDAGLVSGAGIDVTRPEPPPADSAIMRLARRPDVLVTPHIGWAGRETQQKMLHLLGQVLTAFARGERMNRVD